MSGEPALPDVFPGFLKSSPILLGHRLVIQGNIPKSPEHGIVLGSPERFHKTQCRTDFCLGEIVDQGVQAFSVGHDFIIKRLRPDWQSAPAPPGYPLRAPGP